MKARTMIRRLSEIKNRFSPEERAVKHAFLSELRGTDILDPDLLIRYHDTLLFIRAYPDDETLFRMVCRECKGFGKRVEMLHPEEVERLAESGIARTRVSYWYDHSIVSWLVRWYGDALEIDWEEYDDTDKLDALLPLLAAWVESDALDLADISTEDWIELAKGEGSNSGLRWLLEGIGRLKASPQVRAGLYDSLELPVVWDLGESYASTTHTGVPFDKPLFHDGPLLRKIKNFRREITRPLPEIKPADPKTARFMIKAVRSALAVRHRSLYPVEHANPEEVLVAHCGRGYQLVMLGTLPEYRLPVESDYGALIVKNGFVIGYGVGALLFDQVEIAVNIFDTWRGGEAGFIFAQFARAFHNQFGCTRIKIERYQVGHENDEGLKSGSFWFYYKMGFVPRDQAVRKLAEREMKKINRDRSYRTPIATLKKLATSDLYYSLRGDPSRIPDEIPLADLSLNTTRLISARFDGDRRKAMKTCALEAAKTLGCRRWNGWDRSEREWFQRLSLIAALIPGLNRWTREEKKAMAAIMRAKGSKGETGFVRQMLKHKKLQKALWKASVTS